MHNFIVKQFDEFLKQTETEFIPIKGVSIDKVFETYFKRLPPFGQGKKKDEFPDAFVLEALEKWCLEHEDKIIVMSSDNDMKETCNGSQNLQCFGKLEELFNILTKDEALYTLVSELISSNIESVKESIKEEFEYLAFWIDDEDGDVESVCVNDMEFIGNPLIINIEDDTATIYHNVIIDFDAEVSYKDYDNSVYDKEEGKYLFLDNIDNTINRREEVEVELKFRFSIDDSSFFDIESISINDNADISITVDDSWYH